MEQLSKKRNRKSPKQYREEHELFILLMQEQKPTREIMTELQLTMVQFRRHLLDALTQKEIVAYQPQYEAIEARHLPAAILAKFPFQYGGLIKIEKVENGVLLSRLSIEREGI